MGAALKPQAPDASKPVGCDHAEPTKKAAFSGRFGAVDDPKHAFTPRCGVLAPQIRGFVGKLADGGETKEMIAAQVTGNFRRSA
jgi:hypothetical protein